MSVKPFELFFYSDEIILELPLVFKLLVEHVLVLNS